MDRQGGKLAAGGNKTNLLSVFAKNYSASAAGTVLSALSAWMIVTGLKGLAGVKVTRPGALADLAGIALIVVLARWIHIKYKIR